MSDVDSTFIPAHAAPKKEQAPTVDDPEILANRPLSYDALTNRGVDPLFDAQPDPLFNENSSPAFQHELPLDTSLNEESTPASIPVPKPAPAPAPQHAAAPDSPPVPEHMAPRKNVTSTDTTAEIDVDAVEAGLASESSTTGEIDVDAIEAQLSDPGSTQSFQAIPDERINTDSTYDAGTTTQLMWGARSDVGCVRTHNEDSYLVQSPLFCVSDGMGGHAAGEVASSIAVETIAKLAPTTADPVLLAQAVEAANAAIIEAAANGLGKPGMGCTATCAYIAGNTLAIAHVGDSRAYLVHEGTLIKVTRDHSYVEELVDAGEITADEARVHPNRSVITRALGSDPAMYADHFQLNIEKGDRLILCSDGLSSMIPDNEIESISNQSPTAQMATDNLVDAALAAGGSDNVTVIVIDIMDDERLRKLMRKRKRNVLIAVGAFIAALVVALVITSFAITNSVYLGVKDDNVAVWRGVPNSFLGINLHWLEDETTIELDDLPEDTQRRLEEGIPQSSMDQARETIANYRTQIDVEQTSRIETAEAIRNSSTQDNTNASTETNSTDSTTSPEGGNA